MDMDWENGLQTEQDFYNFVDMLHFEGVLAEDECSMICDFVHRICENKEKEEK